MLTRRALFALGAIALMLAAGSAALGQAQVVVEQQITITVDQNEVHSDVPPIMVQNQTLVPVRSIFTALNAQVDWYPSTRRVHVVGNNKDIWVGIGVPHADVNNVEVPLSVPPMIYQGRTMVPIRFMAETLGATVSWNPDTQQITILTQRTAQTPAAEPEPGVVTPAPPATATPGGTGASPDGDDGTY